MADTVQKHIDSIVAGDTIIHNGDMVTVCAKDIKHDTMMGTSVFGDSYNIGSKMVTVVEPIHNIEDYMKMFPVGQKVTVPYLDDDTPFTTVWVIDKGTEDTHVYRNPDGDIVVGMYKEDSEPLNRECNYHTEWPKNLELLPRPRVTHSMGGHYEEG